jgi:uncharacterized protein YdaU (DUF1376 family)
VQALHPTARAGYVWLLMRQWDTEDCSLANNPATLAANAGLSAADWKTHGPEILKRFDHTDNGRLRNAVCFEAWTNVGAAYEAQRLAAERTNAKRWGNQSVTDPPTESVTDPPTESVTDNNPEIHINGKAVNGAAQTPKTMAARLMQLLGLAAGDYDLNMVAQVIAFEARAAHMEPEEAARFLLQAAQSAIERGETVNTFWFKDRKFAQENGNGKNQRSPAKERIDGARRVLAEIALERGLIDPPRTDGGLDAEIPEPRSR